MGHTLKSLNALVPFADPSRPLWRDAIYSVILCTFLYFAPHIPWAHLWHGAANKPDCRVCQEANRQRLLNQPNQPNQQDTQAGPHRPPPPTVEDDSDSDDSLDDEDLAALIHDAETRGALADPFVAAAGEAANPQQRAGPQQLQPTPGQPRRLRDPNRQIGAKKAKSLARRERLRAYHEFMREQGDMQRAQEASVAPEREKELAEIRVRRAKVEAEIQEREKKRRERKKEREEQRAQEEREAIQKASDMVADGLKEESRVKIQQVAQAVDRDATWVENLVRKDGILGLKSTTDGKVLTMLTSKGWIVRVTEGDMQQLHAEASTYEGATSGKVSWAEMGGLLDKILHKQPIAH